MTTLRALLVTSLGKPLILVVTTCNESVLKSRIKAKLDTLTDVLRMEQLRLFCNIVHLGQIVLAAFCLLIRLIW